MPSIFRKRLLVTSLLVVADCAIPIVSTLRERCDLASRRKEAGTIFLASKFYAHDHQGHMPGNFDQLTNYLPKAYALHASGRFELVSPGVAETANADAIFVRERYPDKRGRRIVAHIDGSEAVTR